MAVSSSATWGCSHSVVASPMPMAALRTPAAAPDWAITAMARRPGQARPTVATVVIRAAAAHA